jgi:hypothetical protein
MNFKAFGPVELPRVNGIIAFTGCSKTTFMNSEIESGRLPKDIENAIGCYVFVVSSGNKPLPWYVGKAEKTCLLMESVGPHKVEVYNNVIAENGFVKNGRPLMYYYAKMTDGGKFSYSCGRDIDFAETFLIHMAYARNPGIANVQKKILRRDVKIDGLLNDGPGKKANAAVELASIFGV